MHEKYALQQNSSVASAETAMSLVGLSMLQRASEYIESACLLQEFMQATSKLQSRSWR